MSKNTTKECSAPPKLKSKLQPDDDLGLLAGKKARETYSDQKRHLFPIFRTNGVTRQSAHSSGEKLNYIFRHI